MSLQSLVDAVGVLGREAMDIPVGDPRLGDLIARIDALEGELGREKGMSAPLVPDSQRPPSIEETTARDLERALASLRSAVKSKQS
jgi:hypothetical protein